MIEKTYTKKEEEGDELDAWINGLYEDDLIEIVYRGKRFTFSTQYPTGIAMRLQQMDSAERQTTLVSILSKDPKLQKRHVEKMPADFMVYLTPLFKAIETDTKNMEKKSLEVLGSLSSPKS